MAIATLADLYDNPKVFTGVVKIRKGMAAQLILDTKSTGGLHKWFYILAKDILKKIKSTDPNSMKTKKICLEIMKITENEGKAAILGNYAQGFNTISPVIIAITSYHLFAKNVLHEVKDSSIQKFVMAVPKLTTITDYISAILFFLAISFILGYGITLSRQIKGLKRADL